MEVKIERDDDLKIISLNGSLDVATSDKARDEVIGMLDSKPTIVSMKNCDYVSSSGLRALLMIAKTAKSKKIKLVYAEAIDEVVDVLEMTGFIKMLQCVKTLEEAETIVKG